MIQTIIFAVLLIAGFGVFGYNIWKVRSNILLGRDIDRSDNSGERWKTMLLVAFGQQKMFSRPIPALLHLVIYASF
ncbi:MAG: Fe-S oxidoreductase, partial [Crocinitomicaceae bacterium]|nr:Fe-S oxidoreductase [Crocinitomicaceae bacterium]